MTTPTTETMNALTEQLNAQHTAQLDALRKVYAKMQEIEKQIAEIAEKASPPPAAATTETATASYAAVELVMSISEGKEYFKVKTAEFMQFGVTIWPEVLKAAGIDPEALDPRRPLDLTGWTATASMKENGQPKKVIKLEKVNA